MQDANRVGVLLYLNLIIKLPNELTRFMLLQITTFYIVIITHCVADMNLCLQLILTNYKLINELINYARRVYACVMSRIHLHNLSLFSNENLRSLLRFF